MNPWLLLGLGLAGIALALVVPRWRLKRALDAPFPDNWERVLRRNLPVYAHLPEELRERLRRKVKRFLYEKHFTGCDGLEMTDEIRVTVAAEACMLVLNLPGEVYPGLRYILVYPGAFLVEHEGYDEVLDDGLGLVTDGPQELHGESWDNGRVILAWDKVLHGSRDMGDGYNVVMHEFAHQLDSESGATDGAPLLGGEHSYRTWSGAFSEAFAELQEDAMRGRRSVLDHYGAEHPAEFFAVATETFFERPADLAREHPEVYAELSRFYRLDPREWRRDPSRRRRHGGSAA